MQARGPVIIAEMAKNGAQRNDPRSASCRTSQMLFEFVVLPARLGLAHATSSIS
jgi:hypothetical protein